MRKTVTIIIIAFSLFVSASYALSLGLDPTKMSVSYNKGDAILNENGLDLPISFIVNNPTRFTIFVKSAEYEGILESSGEKISSGIIENIRIHRFSSTHIEIIAHSDLTSKQLKELIQHDHVWVRVNVNVNIFGLFEFAYSDRFDVKDSLISANIE